MNVRFFAGTKAQYLSLPIPRNPLGLYFCEDTKELFWADRLLTDGIRVVPTQADLPELSLAADGTVYYVAETRNGYVLSPDRSEWLQTIYAPATDAYKVPESEVYNTVTTVGAVRDIEAKIYKTIDERIANIEVSTDSTGVKTIFFAGVELAEADGVFSIDRASARRALGFKVPEGQEETEIELATKDYVDNIPTIDLSNKADNIPFTEDYAVGSALGEFVVGDSVKNMTIREILIKLLGLTVTGIPDDPDGPEVGDSVVEEIVTNNTPMYSVNADGEVAEISYDDVIIYTEEAASKQPTESGFYQITAESGEVIESGYQETTVNNPDVPYIIALPIRVDFNTMVTVQTYDTLEGTWKNDSLEMSNDYEEISALCNELGVDISHIDTTQYTLWADMESGPSGKIHRFIIKE